MTPRPGGWALVTGASSGIGEALARSLAARGHSLLLTARSAERLDALAKELAERHRIAVETFPLDLAAAGAAAALFEATEGSGREVDVLVNNAGFGVNAALADVPPARVEEMLRLNVLAVTSLTRLFLAPMRARRHGAILNIASTQAFLPMPFLAVYAASKAYLVSFSEALHVEVERDGILVTCLCPGYTRTRFVEAAGMRPASSTLFPEMSAEDVAEIGLDALDRGQTLRVTHPLDRLWIFTGRFVPRGFGPRVAGLLFRR